MPNAVGQREATRSADRAARRPAGPADIAEAVAFLASERAAFIT